MQIWQLTSWSIFWSIRVISWSGDQGGQCYQCGPGGRDGQGGQQTVTSAGDVLLVCSLKMSFLINWYLSFVHCCNAGTAVVDEEDNNADDDADDDRYMMTNCSWMCTFALSQTLWRRVFRSVPRWVKNFLTRKRCDGCSTNKIFFRKSWIEISEKYDRNLEQIQNESKKISKGNQNKRMCKNWLGQGSLPQFEQCPRWE